MSRLDKLGYYFDDEGVLRTQKDKELFKFTTQEEYEELGEAITEKVYDLLETKCGLIKTPLKPSGSKKQNEENLSFIYVSEDCQKKKTLLVLMHGSGVVRAGQWARRLIINNNLECGTQIPYIERALKNDWGVVVMNSNHNSTEDEEFKFSATPVEHCKTAWRTWVHDAEAEKVYVVAHSRGGYDLSCVMKTCGDSEKVRAICLTDAGFDFPSKWVENVPPVIVVNFLAYGKIDSPNFEIVPFQKGEVQDLYAGTQIHEWSSHCSINAIFHIFESDINEDNYIGVITAAKGMVTKTTNEQAKS